MHQETLEKTPPAANAKSDWLRWFENKEFTTDWLTHKLPRWFPALAPFRDQAVQVLDVGSFEGRSSIAFLEYLPASRVTTIDMFVDAEIEGRFDRNLAPYADRTCKVKGRAAQVLDDLHAKGEEFDVIYLDAGKRRDEVFAHSALAWPLLKVGGVLIWDDLLWERERPAAERPEYGIRHFCVAFADSLTILHDGSQMIVTKTRNWPKTAGIAFYWQGVRSKISKFRPKRALKRLVKRFRRRLLA